MNKKNRTTAIALVGVFVLFAALVPVYWAVSNGSPDGLDSLLQKQNVQEKEPVYKPPLAELQDYGLTMPLYITSGIIGGLAVLAVFVLLGRALKRDRSQS